MKREEVNLYVCPETRKPLTLEAAEESGGEIVSGVLAAEGGRQYQIRDGMPDLTYPPNLAEQDAHARSFYDGRVEAYDKFLYLTFKTHGEDEQALRNKFIDALNSGPRTRARSLLRTGRDPSHRPRSARRELFPKDIAPGCSTSVASGCRSRGPTVLPVSERNTCHSPTTISTPSPLGAVVEFSDIIGPGRDGARAVGARSSSATKHAAVRARPIFEILVTRTGVLGVPSKNAGGGARGLPAWVSSGLLLIAFRVGEVEPVGYSTRDTVPRGGTTVEIPRPMDVVRPRRRTG